MFRWRNGTSPGPFRLALGGHLSAPLRATAAAQHAYVRAVGRRHRPTTRLDDGSGAWASGLGGGGSVPSTTPAKASLVCAPSVGTTGLRFALHSRLLT